MHAHAPTMAHSENNFATQHESLPLLVTFFALLCHCHCLAFALPLRAPCTALHCTVLYCTALRCAVLYSTPLPVQTKMVEAHLEDVKKRMADAEAALAELKKKAAIPHGSIFWMEREIIEKKKYLPQSKQ